MTENEELLAIAKRYEDNEQKLRNAGKRAMYYCDKCVGCKYYEDVGDTNADMFDPITHGICRHKELQNQHNCKGREALT